MFFIFFSLSFFQKEKNQLDTNLLIKDYLYKKSFFHKDVKQITYYTATFLFNNKVYNEKGTLIDFEGNIQTLIKVENSLEKAVEVFIDLKNIGIHNSCRSFQTIKKDYFLVFKKNQHFISFWISPNKIKKSIFQIKEILEKEDSVYLKTVDLRNKKKIVVKF